MVAPAATITGNAAPPVATVNPMPAPMLNAVASGCLMVLLTMPASPLPKLIMPSLKDILPSSHPSVEILSLSFIQSEKMFLLSCILSAVLCSIRWGGVTVLCPYAVKRNAHAI